MLEYLHLDSLLIILNIIIICLIDRLKEKFIIKTKWKLSKKQQYWNQNCNLSKLKLFPWYKIILGCLLIQPWNFIKVTFSNIQTNSNIFFRNSKFSYSNIRIFGSNIEYFLFEFLLTNIELFGNPSNFSKRSTFEKLSKFLIKIQLCKI